MRIAVWHNLPSGGGKRALYDQVHGLVARGHHVEVWCPPTADNDYLPLREIVPEHVVPLKLKGHLEPTHSLLEKLHPLHWSARSQLRAMKEHSLECANQMDSKSFDLLFAACCLVLHTPAIARFTKLPSVLYLQEPNRPFYESSPELPWIAMSWEWKDLLNHHFWRKAAIRKLHFSGIRLQAREERANAMAFREILVNSSFSRENVLRAFGIDSKVCYLGVDSKKFVNLHQKRATFVVCVAALLPNKNIEFLVKSLANITPEHRPTLVSIANTVLPSYLDQLRALAKQVRVDFQLKHRIQDAELVDILNRARMMVYAPRLEPFGYAPLEASACGLPVVAVAEGGIRETVEDGVNGLLVEHDAQRMAEAVEKVLLDDRLHQRLSDAASRLAQTKWSLESSLDRLEEKLKAALRQEEVATSDPHMRPTGMTG